MEYELIIEQIYSDCYPKEQSDDSNYFKIKCNTIEKVSEYVNNLYEKTKEYCVEKPSLNTMVYKTYPIWVLHTYDFIPKDKQATKEEIKLLRDKNDYIPKRDIEMYSISVWLKVLE